MMIEWEKIKLVIWDLDETFWRGTLSEGEITPLPEHIRLIRRLTDCGIINTVCSKNEEAQARETLRQLGVEDLLVFCSINWLSKGERIRTLLADMKLRSENALFLDDNPSNRNEAEYYNPGLMTGGPQEIPALLAFAERQTASDPEHRRLASYRMLEQKREAQQKSASNEAFLMESNIKVSLWPVYAAGDGASPEAEPPFAPSEGEARGGMQEPHPATEQETARIAEMIQRTNQLNYTKKRLDPAETRALLADPGCACGYVTARDRFGDYGMIGFYAVRDGRLEHFLFSCRTLGMAVEQYVYAALGSPALTVEGDVAASVRSGVFPPWINQDRELVQEGRRSLLAGGKRQRILFKGPCDLNSLFAFLEESDSIDSEFTYVSPRTGVNVEQINHSVQILESLTLTQAQKRLLTDELPFADEGMFSDKLFRETYDVVCLSYLADCNLGVYRRKETGERIAFLQGYYPITEEENWGRYLRGEVYTARFSFTEPFLRWFRDHYAFEGILTPDEILENLTAIREHLPPETLLVLILGVEIPFEKNRNPAYEGRHLIHREINGKIRRMAEERDNVAFLDLNRYIRGQESFYDQFNHFVQQVYYDMARELIALIAEKKQIPLTEKSRLFLRVETLKEDLRMLKNTLLGRTKHGGGKTKRM